MFGEDSARGDIRGYRKRGPLKQTKLILNAIRSLNLKNVDLLDIGGGIGVIHHELLDDVADQATHVDASSAYLKEAKAEAARRGHAERVHFIHADFTDVASEIPPADVVTLDRVVCCYPDFRRLLKPRPSTVKARFYVSARPVPIDSGSTFSDCRDPSAYFSTRSQRTRFLRAGSMDSVFLSGRCLCTEG
jgi:2-polyprenyl-3-methyl-5-hydroxy-6-metoxy-1,4-benzoquinol methylase